MLKKPAITHLTTPATRLKRQARSKKGSYYATNVGYSRNSSSRQRLHAGSLSRTAGPHRRGPHARWTAAYAGTNGEVHAVPHARLHHECYRCAPRGVVRRRLRRDGDREGH